jgi:hypothetical protein
VTRGPGYFGEKAYNLRVRQTLSLVLVLLMLVQLGPAVFGADSVRNQINKMPTGANIEVYLKDQQMLRGMKGDVTDSGFTLENPSAGNRQIAFGDISSVKRIKRKTHSTRNVLILLGVVVVGAVGVLAIDCATHTYCGK